MVEGLVAVKMVVLSVVVVVVSVVEKLVIEVVASVWVTVVVGVLDGTVDVDVVVEVEVVVPPSSLSKHCVWMVSSLTIPPGPRTSQPPHPDRGHCTYFSCSLVILPLYGHRVLAVTCQLTQTRAGYGVSVRPAVFS